MYRLLLYLYLRKLKTKNQTEVRAGYLLVLGCRCLNNDGSGMERDLGDGDKVGGSFLRPAPLYIPTYKAELGLGVQPNQV